MPEPSFPHRPAEALALLVLGLALSVGIAFLPGAPDTVSGSLKPLLMFLAWIGPAYALAARRGHDPLVVHAVYAPVTGLGPVTLVTIVVLALYAGGFVAWAHLARLEVKADAATVAREAAVWLVWGFLFVALPEEYFFRGVLQPALDRPGGGGLRVLGAELGRGALLSALAFGLGHVAIDMIVHGGKTSPERAATGLSALWFAWVRVRTGNVLPAAVVHALANAVFVAVHRPYGL